MLKRLAAAGLVLVMATPALAQQQVVVPNAWENTAGPTAFLGPLANAQRTYQLLINENQLTDLVGLPLTSFTYRLPASATGPWPTGDITFDNYDVYLSGSVAPANRSLTFADNIVGPQTQVRSGPMTILANSYPSGSSPNAFGPEVTFDTPWVYTGGHLLLELRHTGFTGTSRSVDAVGTAAATGYGTDFSAAWTGNYQGVSGSQGNFSIVRFNAIPEPTSALALVGAGLLVLRRRRA